MNVCSFVAAGSSFVFGEQGDTLFDLFQKGGWIMWVLLLLSVGVAVILGICWFTTRSRAVLSTSTVELVESALRKRDSNGIAALCSNKRTCYERVFLVVAKFLQSMPKAESDKIRKIADAECERQAGYLVRPITWLSDIGALAPMLGLLGTVFGMMKTFFEIALSTASGSQLRVGMSSGLAEAMITTAGGILVAIPALIGYSWFRSKVHKQIGNLDAAVTHSIAILGTQLDKYGSTTSGEQEILSHAPADAAIVREVRGL